MWLAIISLSCFIVCMKNLDSISGSRRLLKGLSSWEVLYQRRLVGQHFHLTSGHLCVVTGCQKMQLKAALALCLSSVEGDGTDVVSEVVPTQHQASGLQAALMSSPEWLASWWRWPVLSPPPRSACAALIGGRRKRDFRIIGDNALDRKRYLFPPHLDASLFTPIIISSKELRITSANMSCAWGKGQMWSERCQVFLLEDVSVRCAKYLLVFHLILITLLALNIRVLFMLLVDKKPEDWNNDPLYWSHIIVARKKTIKSEQPEAWSHQLSWL